MYRLMKKMLCLGLLLAATGMSFAQHTGFTIKGNAPGLPDGTSVSLLLIEKAPSESIAQTTVKGGTFELQGELTHSQLCQLVTNNLDIVSKHHWPNDSIHWTYTEAFVDNVPMQAELLGSGRKANFRISGGEAQRDYTIFKSQQNNHSHESLVWKFIQTHPTSIVSAYLANQLLERGYNLSPEQVNLLAETIRDTPGDSIRHAEFKNKLQYARQTATGAPLVDLELTDRQGQVTTLTQILPAGKYVLVDFWASWCGICLAAMPRIETLEKQYQDKGFAVVCVSCDTQTDAWTKALTRQGMANPQYRLSKQGYKDFFTKYRVGNGVPYYLFVTPEGKVIKSPSDPEEIARLLECYCQ